MEKIDNAYLGEGKVSSLVVKLAVPSVCAQIINMLYNIIDRIYIGHIENVGTAALTGVGVCAPLIYIISAFAALIYMGASPKASIAMGEGDMKKAEKIMGNSLTLIMFVSMVLTVVISIFKEPLLLCFGASENTISYASDYMGIYVLGTVFVSLSLGMNSFITAQGFAKTAMITVITGAAVNIVLDPIFIFALNMGVSGAAAATVISQAVSMLCVISFLMGKRTLLSLHRENLMVDFKIMLPCLFLGLSPFIMQSTESLLAICFNASLLKYGGDTSVGAMTILTSVMQLCMMPLSGFCAGANPVTSYNFGAKKASRVKESFFTLLKVSVAFSAIFAALVLLFPSVFVSVFTDDTSLISYSVWAIRIYMAATAIFGVQIACQQTFIAIGNAKISLFLAIFRKIILLIPLIYILPAFFENKAMAVYLAEPAADVIAVATTAILFSVQFKRALKSLNN